MAFRRKDDHRYRASDSDTRLTRFRPKYKAAHDKSSERELPEICRYCVRAHKLFDSDTMLCERKGVVSCRYTCRKFVYDPLKHVPFQAPAAFDEDMIMPTLDDIPDDEPTAPGSAAESLTDNTAKKSSGTEPETKDGDQVTAEDKADNAGMGSGSAAALFIVAVNAAGALLFAYTADGAAARVAYYLKFWCYVNGIHQNVPSFSLMITASPPAGMRMFSASGSIRLMAASSLAM